MNNKFNAKKVNVFSGKQIREKNLIGAYVNLDKQYNSVFIWANRASNFLLIDEDNIYISCSHWDIDEFVHFNGNVEFNN